MMNEPTILSEEPETFRKKIGRYLTTLKTALVALFILLLLIPVALFKGLIWRR